ncbi:MAG: hypothetical protein J6I31_03460 [Prevotella sp.]|nr:hypothetical protein [Prevotella sp.]
MKKLSIITAFMLISIAVSAQQESKPFKGYFVNDELEVYLRINLYDNMDIPEHELFGPLPGFLAKQHNGFYWLITDAKVKGIKATVAFINDYGSEDLTATFLMPNDSTLVLEQKEGSPIKVPKKGKWFKLPSKITFKRK